MIIKISYSCHICFEGTFSLKKILVKVESAEIFAQFFSAVFVFKIAFSSVWTIPIYITIACHKGSVNYISREEYMYVVHWIFYIVFDSYKMVSQDLTSLVLTLGKWNIFWLKLKLRSLSWQPHSFFWNFYIFLVYIRLTVLFWFT